MKKQKDCLFLCQFFYPEYVSSATLPFDTAVALTNAGYSVGALCGYPNEYSLGQDVPYRETCHGIEIWRLQYLQLKRSSLPGRLLNYLSFTAAVFLHLPYMRNYRMIFVYSNPPILPLIAALAKRLFRLKLVFISYDVYPEIGIKAGKIKAGSITDKGFRRLNRCIARSADRIVAVSQDMKDFLQRERKLPEDSIRVIPNWYEKEDWNGRRGRSNPLFKSIPANAFIVSYFGNLGTCQELGTLLKAIRSLADNREIHFVFAGHGNKMPLLKKAVEKESLEQVHIFDFLQGENYLDALSISDVCTVTLVKGLKGLCSPSKVYSYLMAGKPVLGVMDREMELAIDIEKHECGFLVTHHDVSYMKDCILKLKNTPDLCGRMGRNGRELYEKKYEKRVCLAQYLSLVKERLGDHV